MTAQPPGGHSRIEAVGLIAWWILLALQIWFAWDLSEIYARLLILLRVGPETPFALAGLLLGGLGLRGRLRRRAWGMSCAQVLTLAAGIWLLVAQPVMLLGARLHLWRNEDRYLAEVAAARAAMAPGGARADLPDSAAMFVDGRPPRFGFDLRSTGLFHWAALVYDPDHTLDAQSGRPSTMFGYTMLGYDHLNGDWYVVAAMK